MLRNYWLPIKSLILASSWSHLYLLIKDARSFVYKILNLTNRWRWIALSLSCFISGKNWALGRANKSLALLDCLRTGTLSFRPLPSQYTDWTIPAPLLYPGSLLKFLPWNVYLFQNFVYGKFISKLFTYANFNGPSLKTFYMCYWLHGCAKFN